MMTANQECRLNEYAEEYMVHFSEMLAEIVKLQSDVNELKRSLVLTHSECESVAQQLSIITRSGSSGQTGTGGEETQQCRNPCRLPR